MLHIVERFAQFGFTAMEVIMAGPVHPLLSEASAHETDPACGSRRVMLDLHLRPYPLRRPPSPSSTPILIFLFLNRIGLFPPHPIQTFQQYTLNIPLGNFLIFNQLIDGCQWRRGARTRERDFWRETLP